MHSEVYWNLNINIEPVNSSNLGRMSILTYRVCVRASQPAERFFIGPSIDYFLPPSRRNYLITEWMSHCIRNRCFGFSCPDQLLVSAHFVPFSGPDQETSKLIEKSTANLGSNLFFMRQKNGVNPSNNKYWQEIL